MPPRLRPITSPGFVCLSCRFRLLRTSGTAAAASRCRYSQQRRLGPGAPSPAANDHQRPAAPPAVDDGGGYGRPVIRYYEQIGKEKPRMLRGEEEFNRSMQTEHDAIAAQLEDLESKLVDMGKLMDQIDTADGKPDKETFGRAGRTLRSLRRRAGRGGPDVLDDEPPQADIPLVELSHFQKATTIQREALRSLNKYLAAAEKRLDMDNVDANVVMRMWKQYSGARRVLATSWQAVPHEVWDLLWRILASEVRGVVNRMAHIYALATDMQAAGASLDSRQKLLAVEAMFVSGYEKQAIENWRRMVTSVGAEPETKGDFWLLGVRMTCLAGDLVRAERAVANLFEAVPEADPRVLLHLIKAYATHAEASQKAWPTYRRLRETLGTDMQIEDYDEVISHFLASGKTEHAFHAFVDMMFSGSVDLFATKRLPTQVANQFFLGKWLKRLIGAGDLDGAFQVLQFMESHGVLAAPIQVNGLIGAWMRSGEAENQQKAEDLAWAMVRSRMVFVNLRKQHEQRRWPEVLRKQSKEDAEASSGRSGAGTPQATLNLAPRASTETFCLLAQNYCQRGMHKRLEELWAASKTAEIMDATFLANQLLRSFANQGKFEEARKFYNLVVKEQGVKPDGETFATRYRAIAATDGEPSADMVAACRQLFSEMMAAPWKLYGQNLVERLPMLVLHKFRTAGDPIGVIVALRAMRRLFGFQPTEAILAEVSLAITPRRAAGPAASARRLTIANSQLEKLLQLRFRERHASGEAKEKGELSAEETTDELNVILERLLWLGQDIPAENEFNALFVAAAEQMGVADVLVQEDAEAMARKRKFVPQY